MERAVDNLHQAPLITPFYVHMAKDSGISITEKTKDELASADWTLNACNGIVVRDYTNTPANGTPDISVLKAGDLFDYLKQAGENKRKIAVYEIGKCILDWS